MALSNYFRVQRAFCFQQDRDEKAASALYNSVLKTKPSDIGLIAVASNNICCIQKDQAIFDSRKKMKTATSDGLEGKLTTRQRKLIALNNCLLSFYSNQVY